MPNHSGHRESQLSQIPQIAQDSNSVTWVTARAGRVLGRISRRHAESGAVNFTRVILGPVRCFSDGHSDPRARTTLGSVEEAVTARIGHRLTGQRPASLMVARTGIVVTGASGLMQWSRRQCQADFGSSLATSRFSRTCWGWVETSSRAELLSGGRIWPIGDRVD